MAKNPNPGRAQQPCKGILSAGINLMIAEAAENAEGRTQRREGLNHFALRTCIPGEKVTGQYDQVGFQSVGNGCTATNLLPSHEGADVQIGKLDDTESLKGFGQAWQSDGLPRDFHIKASAEKPIAGDHEGGGAYQDGGPLKKLTATRRWRDEGEFFRLQSGAR